MATRKHTIPTTQLDFSFTPAEEWRDIPGYEGLYQVSNLGRIKNARPVSTRKRHSGNQRRGGRIMTQFFAKDGYLRIRLCKQGKVKNFAVHALVLQTFVGPTEPGLVCNHLDCN